MRKLWFRRLLSLILIIILVSSPLYSLFLPYRSDWVMETKSANTSPNQNALSLNVYSQQKKNIFHSSLVSLQKTYDTNGNKISDKLEKALLNISNDDKLRVGIICFSKEDAKDVLNTLKETNIPIIGFWESISTIHIITTKAQLSQLLSVEFRKIALIYPAWYHAKPLNNIANRLTHVRPFIWNTYGYMGDPNSAIAIVDSGVDDTHSMLSIYSDKDFSNPNVKIVGWYDPTGTSLTPYDNDGHGTHVASIAAGNFYDGDPDDDNLTEITVDITYVDVENDGNEYSYIIGFYLNTTGLINATVIWTSDNPSTAYVSSLALVDPSASRKAEDLTDPFNVTYNLTTNNFGIWRVIVGVRNSSSTANSLKMQVILEVPVVNSSDGYIEYSGVAPNAKIVAVAALADGSTADILDSLNWIYNHAEEYHILVVSNSWTIVDDYGNPTTDPGIELAIRNLIKKGLVVVAAAGNWGNTLLSNQMGTPANIEEAITVAAADNLLNIAYYSSNGPAGDCDVIKPDIAAPGGDFSYGAIIGADTNDYEEYGYEILNSLSMLQGTSMATPHVAGIAALLAQALGGYNNWDYDPPNKVKSKAFKIKQVLLMTSWEISTRNGWKDYKEGFGLVQADAAIEALTKTWDLNYVASDYLYGKDHPFKKHVWARGVDLLAGGNYTFYLHVPDTGDFDLYVYDPDPNEYGEPVLVAYSNQTQYGGTEIVNFQPTKDGRYYVIVKQAEGYGEFQLSSFYLSPIYVNILSPSNNTLTNKENITIKWDVETEYTIDHFEIKLNETLILSNIPAENLNSTVTLPIEGFWKIMVTAVATNGAKGSNYTFVMLDTTPPEINISVIHPQTIVVFNVMAEEIIVPEGSQIVISLMDNFYLKNATYSIDNTINETYEISSKSYEITISSSVIQELSTGNHTLYVIAFDAADNFNETIFIIEIVSSYPTAPEMPPYKYVVLPFVLIGLFFVAIVYFISTLPAPANTITTVIILVSTMIAVILRKRKAKKH